MTLSFVMAVIVIAMVIYVIGWSDAYNHGVADTERRWHDAVVRHEAYAKEDTITIVGGTWDEATAKVTTDEAGAVTPITIVD